MKKITWTWKKIITLIGTAFGIGMLVSCYGMPPNWSPDDYDNSDYEYNDDEENDSENDDVEDSNVISLTDIK